jgi:hypothetical protein
VLQVGAPASSVAALLWCKGRVLPHACQRHGTVWMGPQCKMPSGGDGVIADAARWSDGLHEDLRSLKPAVSANVRLFDAAQSKLAGPVRVHTDVGASDSYARGGAHASPTKITCSGLTAQSNADAAETIVTV